MQVRRVKFSSPVSDPSGSSIPKTEFVTGAKYTVFKDDSGFRVVSVDTSRTVRCNFAAEWEEVEAAPTVYVEPEVVSQKKGKRNA